MTKNYNIFEQPQRADSRRGARLDDYLPARGRNNYNTTDESVSLKSDHFPPKNTTPPASQSPLDQIAITSAARFEDYIRDAMKTYAEDLKSKLSEVEVKECSSPEDGFDGRPAGRTTALNNNALPPRRLNPSVILTPQSAVNSDDEDGYDDEDWKRYEKEITDSANNLNRNVSEQIEKERREYLAAAKKHYLKAKVESPEDARREGEKGILIFKNLMGWVNTVFDKVITLFRQIFRAFFNNFETAMSWVTEQLAKISYKHRIALEHYKVN
ncbi:hypothetical protein TWF788_001295 [Orbilia oligospora]|uniref:Uncharacterized protein n=1 Tax=Orbilia oligospora TaxID=2813651 RepID=A0A7C8P9L9_ORBOL|nr:hypothetical protein TWF788_001295 [Orbilia oligospora]